MDKHRCREGEYCAPRTHTNQTIYNEWTPLTPPHRVETKDEYRQRGCYTSADICWGGFSHVVSDENLLVTSRIAVSFYFQITMDHQGARAPCVAGPVRVLALWVRCDPQSLQSQH